MDVTKIRTVVLLVGPPYWFTVAMIYAGTYWKKFGVNVLEFASFTDVAKMAVLPVVVSAVAILFNTLLHTVLDLFDFQKRRWLHLVVGAIAISLMFVMGFGPAFVLLVMALIIIMQVKDYSPKIFVNKESTNFLIILLVVILPGGAYFNASSNANNVLEGRRYSFATIDERELRYVGYLGDHWFFFDDTASSIRILRGSTLDSIELSYYPEFTKYQPPLRRWLAEDEEVETDNEPDVLNKVETNDAQQDDTPDPKLNDSEPE